MIARQSILNFLSIALAFGLGAISTLYLYPTYPGKAFQGLVVALLAYSNLVQPFIAFGVQHALIKFYTQCKTDQEKDKLLVVTAALLAERRLNRGLKLNHPEAIAIISPIEINRAKF